MTAAHSSGTEELQTTSRLSSKWLVETERCGLLHSVYSVTYAQNMGSRQS